MPTRPYKYHLAYFQTLKLERTKPQQHTAERMIAAGAGLFGASVSCAAFTSISRLTLKRFNCSNLP